MENHKTRHVILVADRFAHFADGEQVLTVSQLMSMASSDLATATDCEWVLHAGQGIEHSDWEVLEAARQPGGRFRVRVAEPDLLPCPVAPATVHKHRAENVLLADLKNILTEHCSATLRVHRDNELILDHHAGRHVPGMVVIEAIRQICIAHFETVYRPGLPPWTYAGIWRRMNVSFEEFLFAVPAIVVSEIVEADLTTSTNVRFRATTSVWQNGGLVVSADIEYSLIKQERLDALERRKAERAARAQLAGLAEQ